MSQQYCRVPSSKRLRITTQKVLLKIIEKFSRKKTTALLSSEGISAYVRLKKTLFLNIIIFNWPERKKKKGQLLTVSH